MQGREWYLSYAPALPFCTAVKELWHGEVDCARENKATGAIDEIQKWFEAGS
jgi:hypothetical protein